MSKCTERGISRLVNEILRAGKAPYRLALVNGQA